MDKKKIIRYSIFAVAFIVLVVIVSISAVKIKHSIIDNEINNTPSAQKLYSTYYNSLSYREQLLYDAVTYAAQNFSQYSEAIDSEYTMEEFQHILSCIRADRPDLFYLNFDELVLYRRTHQTKVEMIYIGTSSEIRQMTEDYRSAVKKALSVINESMSDFEKEVSLTDYIIDNCAYSSVSLGGFENTSYGALVMGRASCEGYAYAVKELLNSVYIESLVIYGKADETEHVWNMVNIDNDYYHLDITWNDSDNNEDKELRFHGYFNLCDAQIQRDHSFEDPENVIPKASKENDYYKQIGCSAEAEDELEDIFYNALLNAVENNREYIEVKYVNSHDNMVFKPYYTDALNRVNSYIGEKRLYDAFSVKIANENTNAVTIQIFYN